MNYAVVIPAAGQGKRMQAGHNKQFLVLEERPLIIHTASVFEQDPWCREIIVVANASEIYGEYIGSRLDEAGVDYQGMNTKWQETGKLEDDDYKALEGAGFSKDMVEAYLDGVQYRAEQDSQLAAKEVAAIKNEFGGEQVYTEMIQWAAANLDKGEVDAFNSMLKTSNPHQIRIAVAGIQAAYMNNAPREPKLVGGRTPRPNTTKFESTAQVVAAMNDPKYKEDPAYRKQVEEKLSRSKVF